jgi:hypothetical protein
MQLTELVTVDVVVVLPYVQAKGNATDQVLTNLNLENERKGLQDVSVFVKYSPFNFNFGSSSLRLIGALGLKTPLSNYKVEEGFQSIIAIGNRSTTGTTGWQCSERIQEFLLQHN